jgi:hypothetical protein
MWLERRRARGSASSGDGDVMWETSYAEGVAREALQNTADRLAKTDESEQREDSGCCEMEVASDPQQL